jgi:CRP/FNR family cyclic AMP-dependent transcriptional regulator
MRTIEQYLPDHPFFAGLDQEALAIVAGCATNVSFAPGEFLFREGQPADQFFVVRRGRVALQVHGPTAGTMVVDTADAGDVVGWSWLVPPYRWLFDARAVEPTGAVSFDGRCLRGKCDQDPHLGYELMKLVTQVMFSRLTAARVRLLDLYGNAGTTGALLSPLLMEARPADAGTTDAGTTHATPG